MLLCQNRSAKVHKIPQTFLLLHRNLCYGFLHPNSFLMLNDEFFILKFIKLFSFITLFPFLVFVLSCSDAGAWAASAPRREALPLARGRTPSTSSAAKRTANSSCAADWQSCTPSLWPVSQRPWLRGKPEKLTRPIYRYLFFSRKCPFFTLLTLL